MILIHNTCIYFNVIALLLSQVLSAPLTEDFDNEDDIYVIFNIKDLKKLPTNYIVYNFEQLTSTNDLGTRFVNRLKRAKAVIDYSKSNIDYLEQIGIYAYFLPYGWNMNMKIRTFALNKRQNDIMFIGWIEGRRKNVLRPVHELCKSKNYNVFFSNECWNTDLDYIMQITKIGLNVHFYEGNTILEVHRIIPYILNKVWVITEHSDDPYYDNLFDDMVTWTTPDSICTDITRVLNTMDDYELENRKRKLIEKCSVNGLIKETFEKIESLT